MQLRLRSSIVLMVVVGLMIPVSVISVPTLHQHQAALELRAENSQRRLLDIVALGMQEPLWDINPEAGLPLFVSLLRDQRIVAITVRNGKNHEFLSKQLPERRLGRQVKLSQKVVYQGEPIGEVVLEMDSHMLDQEVARDRWTFIWTLSSQLLLSLILIVTLLRRRMLLPIGRLMQDSARLAERDLRTPFVWRASDELGSLGVSLEHTRQALLALFDEIESKNLMLEKDIEHRARTEMELQLHRDHLEELVDERTRELQAAKERADVANQAKSTFLSSMTHELRTPLNAVLGYAQILKRDKGLSERQSVGLNTIQQSGEHLLLLITDLLDLAKIEAGKFELVPEPVNLPDFMAGIVNIIRVKAEQKNLQFDYTAGAGLPRTVLIDEKRLRQILLNLLGNAVKFTDAGQVALSVAAVAAPADQVRLRFAVTDSGVGMTSGQLDSIFQPFEQVGDTQRKFGGTGLGLSISRQLVRLMDGDIAVLSQFGAGSEFSFELQVPVSTMEVAPATAERLVVGYLGPRKKILIVDDVAANRDMLKDLLASLGFDIELAENGQEGVQRAISGAPDAVLMDIVMPVMDGLEATRRIRAAPGLASLCVIAISASVTAEEQNETLLAGANAFMHKPVRQNLLLEKIGAFLGLSLVHEAAAEAAPKARPEGPLTAPPESEMSTLRQLALAGDMRAIRLRADHIEALAPSYQGFARVLRQLAQTYQSKAILELVSIPTETRNDA
ncbi:MAG TPA: hybrid sensor histidine kinase/response regulator [Janthinobacterium sp.]|nr:hybrid sensor histidine kinase/response regulator [Janthinobacterium sp.]